MGLRRGSNCRGRVLRVLTMIRRFRRGCGGGVPIMFNNNIFSGRSVERCLSLNLSNIRVTAHFMTAGRYSTTSRFGRVCIGTGGRSIAVIRDPIRVPKQTLLGPFMGQVHGRHRGMEGYFRYLGAYSPHAAPCYVAVTLVETIGKSISGTLIFYNTGTCGVGSVISIRSLVYRLSAWPPERCRSPVGQRYLFPRSLRPRKNLFYLPRGGAVRRYAISSSLFVRGPLFFVSSGSSFLFPWLTLLFCGTSVLPNNGPTLSNKRRRVPCQRTRHGPPFLQDSLRGSQYPRFRLLLRLPHPPLRK